MSLLKPATFLIRDYAPADFPAICAIDRLCFSEAIAYTPEEMALGLVQRGAVAYVAERDAQVIAFVLASQNKRRMGHIITIDILVEFRRKGLGRALLETAERRLKANGAIRVVLEVSVSNRGALRFYEEMKYAMKRLLVRYYPDGTDAWLMEKNLDKLDKDESAGAPALS